MTLDERLAEIGRGKHKALLKRFTSKDWSTSFKITQGHAQKNIKEARERNPERLYTTDEPRYLYVPIPTDEVAHLMADRVNAVGRNDQRLKDAFGENELIAFCEADRRIGGLDADWDGYAKDALKLLVAEGTLEDLRGGGLVQLRGDASQEGASRPFGLEHRQAPSLPLHQRLQVRQRTRQRARRRAEEG